jgi:hypothetical protein
MNLIDFLYLSLHQLASCHNLSAVAAAAAHSALTNPYSLSIRFSDFCSAAQKNKKVAGEIVAVGEGHRAASWDIGSQVGVGWFGTACNEAQVR